ncbi:MAG: Gfo/Idh/MocA family protein [Bacilli bacterium]
MKLAIIGEKLIHEYIYAGHINGFSTTAMAVEAGWMADIHIGRSGAPLDAAVEIVAIASPDGERAASVARACLIPNVYDRIAAVKPDAVDGVMILEDQGAKHRELAMPFLSHGKFVFIDKPVATAISDLQAMESTAQQTGARLCGGSALRYSQTVVQMHQMMSAQKPGSVAISGPGYWFNYACHQVEVLEALFGLTDVRVRAVGSESSGGVVLQWNDGMIATLTYGAAHEPLFRVRAQYTDRCEEWTIADAKEYYLGLSQMIVGVATGRSAPPAPEHRADIVRVLQEVGAQLT